MNPGITITLNPIIDKFIPLRFPKLALVDEYHGTFIPVDLLCEIFDELFDTMDFERCAKNEEQVRLTRKVGGNYAGRGCC